MQYRLCLFQTIYYIIKIVYHLFYYLLLLYIIHFMHKLNNFQIEIQKNNLNKKFL